MRLLNQLIEENYDSPEQTLSIIKPDAVERNLSEKLNQFLQKQFKNIRDKNFIFLKMKLQSFIKFISQNHFMINYVIIYLQVP